MTLPSLLIGAVISTKTGGLINHTSIICSPVGEPKLNKVVHLTVPQRSVLQVQLIALAQITVIATGVIPSKLVTGTLVTPVLVTLSALLLEIVTTMVITLILLEETLPDLHSAEGLMNEVLGQKAH